MIPRRPPATRSPACRQCSPGLARKTFSPCSPTAGISAGRSPRSPTAHAIGLLPTCSAGRLHSRCAQCGLEFQRETELRGARPGQAGEAPVMRQPESKARHRFGFRQDLEEVELALRRIAATTRNEEARTTRAGFSNRIVLRERRYAYLGYLLPLFQIEPAGTRVLALALG